MRHISSTVRPAARRSLCAVVLLALTALLHATSTSGASHLSALDLNGCLPRHAAVASSQAGEVLPTATLTSPGSGHHQDGDASQSCDASACASRQISGPFSAPLAVNSAAAVAAAPAAHGAAPAETLGSATGPTASRSAVLRC